MDETIDLTATSHSVYTMRRRMLVARVFDAAAYRYDAMNDILSGGLHRLWKAHLVSRLMLTSYSQQTIIDVAGGTGDIALAIAAKDRTAHISVIDINAAMLASGRRRAQNYRHGNKRIGFILGDAQCLPLADASVDIYVVGFGIRNFAARADALAEVVRVLRPGGRFLCLEFSYIPHSGLRRAYRAYSDYVIPKLGRLIADAQDAYQYLVDSIAQFPSAPDLANELCDTGLARVRYEYLSGGIVALHSGVRL